MSNKTSGSESFDSIRIGKKMTAAGCMAATLAFGSSSSETSRLIRVHEQPGTSTSWRRDEWDSESTATDYDESLTDVASALSGVGEETFEDGVISRLAIRLNKAISKRPYNAVLAFGTMLASEVKRTSAFAEGIRWLAKMPAASPSAVNNVLSIALRHPSGNVRDAAILAADSLRPKLLAPALRAAQEWEPISQYRADITDLLSELEGNDDVPEVRRSQ